MKNRYEIEVVRNSAGRPEVIRLKQGRKTCVETFNNDSETGILNSLVFDDKLGLSPAEVLSIVNAMFKQQIRTIDEITDIVNVGNVGLVKVHGYIPPIPKDLLVNGNFDGGTLDGWLPTAGATIEAGGWTGNYYVNLAAVTDSIGQIIPPIQSEDLLVAFYAESTVAAGDQIEIILMFTDLTFETQNIAVTNAWYPKLFTPTTSGKTVAEIYFGAKGTNTGDIHYCGFRGFEKVRINNAFALETTLGTVHGHVDSIDTKQTTIQTALQIIDNMISGNEAQVDVVAALPAGTNAIGKLAANSGVDIGDVDVASLPALPTGTNSIGKLTQATKHDAVTPLSARIDTATGTTDVEVVATQGAGNKIYVIGYQIQGKGDVEAVLRSASTDLSPEWDFNAREGAVMPVCVWPAFYFVTAANEALNIYLDAAIRVTGNVQYVVAA